MKTVRKPIVCSYTEISEPKHRLFTWKCPYCRNTNGEIINQENTGKDVECGDCGGRWRLKIEWRDGQ